MASYAQAPANEGPGDPLAASGFLNMNIKDFFSAFTENQSLRKELEEVNQKLKKKSDDYAELETLLKNHNDVYEQRVKSLEAELAEKSNSVSEDVDLAELEIIKAQNQQFRQQISHLEENLRIKSLKLVALQKKIKLTRMASKNSSCFGARRLEKVRRRQQMVKGRSKVHNSRSFIGPTTNAIVRKNKLQRSLSESNMHDEGINGHFLVDLYKKSLRAKPKMLFLELLTRKMSRESNQKDATPSVPSVDGLSSKTTSNSPDSPCLQDLVQGKSNATVESEDVHASSENIMASVHHHMNLLSKEDRTPTDTVPTIIVQQPKQSLLPEDVSPKPSSTISDASNLSFEPSIVDMNEYESDEEELKEVKNGMVPYSKSMADVATQEELGDAVETKKDPPAPSKVLSPKEVAEEDNFTSTKLAHVVSEVENTENQNLVSDFRNFHDRIQDGLVKAATPVEDQRLEKVKSVKQPPMTTVSNEKSEILPSHEPTTTFVCQVSIVPSHDPKKSAQKSIYDDIPKDPFGSSVSSRKVIPEPDHANEPNPRTEAIVCSSIDPRKVSSRDADVKTLKSTNDRRLCLPADEYTHIMTTQNDEQVFAPKVSEKSIQEEPEEAIGDDALTDAKEDSLIVQNSKSVIVEHASRATNHPPTAKKTITNSSPPKTLSKRFQDRRTINLGGQIITPVDKTSIKLGDFKISTLATNDDSPLYVEAPDSRSRKVDWTAIVTNLSPKDHEDNKNESKHPSRKRIQPPSDESEPEVEKAYVQKEVVSRRVMHKKTRHDSQDRETSRRSSRNSTERHVSSRNRVDSKDSLEYHMLPRHPRRSRDYDRRSYVCKEEPRSTGDEYEHLDEDLDEYFRNQDSRGSRESAQELNRDYGQACDLSMSRSPSRSRSPPRDYKPRRFHEESRDRNDTSRAIAHARTIYEDSMDRANRAHDNARNVEKYDTRRAMANARKIAAKPGLKKRSSGPTYEIGNLEFTMEEITAVIQKAGPDALCRVFIYRRCKHGQGCQLIHNASDVTVGLEEELLRSRERKPHRSRSPPSDRQLHRPPSTHSRSSHGHPGNNRPVRRIDVDRYEDEFMPYNFDAYPMDHPLDYREDDVRVYHQSPTPEFCQPVYMPYPEEHEPREIVPYEPAVFYAPVNDHHIQNRISTAHHVHAHPYDQPSSLSYM